MSAFLLSVSRTNRFNASWHPFILSLEQWEKCMLQPLATIISLSLRCLTQIPSFCCRGPYFVSVYIILSVWVYVRVGVPRWGWVPTVIQMLLITLLTSMQILCTRSVTIHNYLCLLASCACNFCTRITYMHLFSNPKAPTCPYFVVLYYTLVNLYFIYWYPPKFTYPFFIIVYIPKKFFFFI